MLDQAHNNSKITRFNYFLRQKILYLVVTVTTHVRVIQIKDQNCSIRQKDDIQEFCKLTTK